MTDIPTEELLQSGYRFAFALTHHAQDAEDLVQGAWLKVQRCYGRVENRMVLFTSIRNLFYDGKRRRRIVQIDAVPEIEDRPATATSVGVNGDLHTLLQFLTSEERETLFLNCVEGYSAREIGEATGISRNTVLGVLARAKRKLQQVANKENEKTAG